MPYIAGTNITAMWSALLHYICDVPGSNLGLQPGYPDWSFCVGFLRPFNQMLEEYLKLDHGYFLPYPVKFIIQHCAIWCYTVRAIDSVIKQTINQ
jgi:hypothetical protein